MTTDEEIRSIHGYLFDDEGWRLKDLAKNWPSDGDIFEIGSFKAKSTAWLAWGVRERGEGRVFAVDHFKGSPEHQTDIDIRRHGSTFQAFDENLTALGLRTQVTPLVGTSQEWSRNRWDPIRVLFIDGDHSSEAIRTDFECWYPHVRMGGAIAFHDYESGMHQAVKDYVDNAVRPKMRFVDLTTTLIVFEKT